MAKTLIVIAGPTAIGKTALSIKLAEYFKSDIISADSRQFYREMEIGTAKPSLKELAAVKHHFINSHSVTDVFNVGDYEREALNLLTDLFKNNDIAILVGGSGLFVKAIVDGFDDIPSSPVKVREKLNRLYNQNGISFLQEKLKEADPEFYSQVDLYNPQRLIRALEVFETSGQPVSEFRKRVKKQRPFNILQLGLNTDRHTLYERINSRVDEMIDMGLVEEVEKLRPFWHLNALNTVGYSEIINYLNGHTTIEEAVEKVKQNTRRFAKRQLTWFNKSKDIHWFNPEEFDNIITHLESTLSGPERVEQSN